MEAYEIGPSSYYHRLGYCSLHIKRETRDRLNMLRTIMAAQAGAAVSQDEALNTLLDRHGVDARQLHHTP